MIPSARDFWRKVGIQDGTETTRTDDFIQNADLNWETFRGGDGRAAPEAAGPGVARPEGTERDADHGARASTSISEEELSPEEFARLFPDRPKYSRLGQRTEGIQAQRLAERQQRIKEVQDQLSGLGDRLSDDADGAESLVPDSVKTVVSGVYKTGEDVQAIRFGDLQGGGNFAFAENANRRGIEGYFINSAGEHVPVSLKRLPTDNVKNVFRVIRDNADEILKAEKMLATSNQSLPAGTLQRTVLHVETPNILSTALTEYINGSKPNIFRSNAFQEILLDAKGGLIHVRDGIIVKGGL
ncbi:hypothetical protein IGB42_03737 [Andreprevotia sp. IGB-42]|uniref:hypothetical protein n=1 Tax=Andreprevotia sp. IGB-42 TaxID=2497473 RepID=UPI0013594CD4|nr:hypothetical protein [Andreprevotia sp. IGB-42]KAF0811720.1 hypothetical protein IGB42_03737 [Andreprevotia sp. IGB-42]